MDTALTASHSLFPTHSNLFLFCFALLPACSFSCIVTPCSRLSGGKRLQGPSPFSDGGSGAHISPGVFSRSHHLTYNVTTISIKGEESTKSSRQAGTPHIRYSYQSTSLLKTISATHHRYAFLNNTGRSLSLSRFNKPS